MRCRDSLRTAGAGEIRSSPGGGPLTPGELVGKTLILPVGILYASGKGTYFIQARVSGLIRSSNASEGAFYRGGSVSAEGPDTRFNKT